MIAFIDITGDADELARYRAAVAATFAPFGGRYLVSGGDYEVLEGDRTPDRISVIEFPDLDAARDWNTSAAYQDIKRLRTRNTTGQRVIVAGV
ncbi:DUF1330 domain-containing protein [Spirillospora sp. CA-253888]